MKEQSATPGAGRVGSRCHRQGVSGLRGLSKEARDLLSSSFLLGRRREKQTGLRLRRALPARRRLHDRCSSVSQLRASSSLPQERSTSTAALGTAPDSIDTNTFQKQLLHSSPLARRRVCWKRQSHWNGSRVFLNSFHPASPLTLQPPSGEVQSYLRCRGRDRIAARVSHSLADMSACHCLLHLTH